MLDLRQYTCLGAALRDALQRWPNETCLIEADRDREKQRLTYSDFKDLASPRARALQDVDLKTGDRAAIIMTNQSKWLVSAYAIFYSGGVLIPLDYKLTAAEHLQLLLHSQAKYLVVEYHLWRAIMQQPQFSSLKLRTVLVTEAPAGTELAGAFHCVFFGHRRAAERVRAHPRELPGTMYRADCLVSVLARRTLSEHPAHQSCN